MRVDAGFHLFSPVLSEALITTFRLQESNVPSRCANGGSTRLKSAHLEGASFWSGILVVIASAAGSLPETRQREVAERMSEWSCCLPSPRHALLPSAGLHDLCEHSASLDRLLT
jgi:hypothetical protein